MIKYSYNKMKLISALFILNYSICYGLNVESAMTYKLAKDVYTKSKPSIDTTNIKGSKAAIKQVAAKGLEKQKFVSESFPIILQKRKSRLTKVQITPDFGNLLPNNNINYDSLAQSFNGGEASIKISESTNIKIRKDFINFSHTY